MSLKKESRSDVQLHIAASNGDLLALRRLLDSGRVHVDSRDRDGSTPLILAAFGGHYFCCEELLEQGANPSSRRKTGTTALFLAAQEGYLDVVRLLLRSGADVNAACKDGGTALMVAAQCGHADVVNELLSNGSNIYQTMKDGATCLFLAAQNGCAKVVSSLLEHAAQLSSEKSLTSFVDMQRHDGTTALWMAAQMGYDHVTHLLLKAGACVNVTRNDGISAVFKTSEKGNVDVLKELLLFNPYLGLNKNGVSPLYAAVMSGNIKTIRLLVQYGADIHLVNNSSLSPYQLATKLEMWNIVQYFDQQNRRGSLDTPTSSPSPTLV